MNLEIEVKNLENKWSNTFALAGKLDDDDYSAEEEPKALVKEIEQEEELANHLGSYHVVPILKWKISVGLERKFGPGECFINYGEDYQHKTIEEEEYFRLMLKRDKALGYDPKNVPNRKF